MASVEMVGHDTAGQWQLQTAMDCKFCEWSHFGSSLLCAQPLEQCGAYAFVKWMSESEP